MDPAISVIIPVYNGETTIRKAIDSILSNKGHLLEVIVVDDGSTDRTREIVESYGDPVYLFLSEGKKSAADARNTGIRKARGKYIAFCDADDEWLPDKLDKQMTVFSEHPDYAFVSGGQQCIDEDDRQLFIRRNSVCGNIIPRMMVGNIVATSTVMARRDAILELDRWMPNYLIVNEDMYLWLQLAARHAVCVIPDILVRYHLPKLGKYNIKRKRQDKERMFEELASDVVIGEKLQAYRNVFYSNMYYRIATETFLHKHLLEGLELSWLGFKAQPTNLVALLRTLRDAGRYIRMAG